MAGAHSSRDKPETFMQYLTQMFNPPQHIKQAHALCVFLIHAWELK